jgi:hypothetical protein
MRRRNKRLPPDTRARRALRLLAEITTTALLFGSAFLGFWLAGVCK